MKTNENQSIRDDISQEEWLNELKTVVSQLKANETHSIKDETNSLNNQFSQIMNENDEKNRRMSANWSEYENEIQKLNEAVHKIASLKTRTAKVRRVLKRASW